MKPFAIDDLSNSFPGLPYQAHKVVLVVDLVESVRLMARDEAAVVAHWGAFMSDAAQRVLPRHKGRLVKSLGDGLLADFDEAMDAVKAAMALHTFFTLSNRQLPADQQLHLRAGINASHIYVGEYDVYGHGVNLAARVTTLGAAGDTVVTAPVRDDIADGLDGEIEDMGESYLTHWQEPVRTWRVYPRREGQPSGRPDKREASASDFRPSIAILAFDARTPAPEHFGIGDLIADGVIAQLARSQDVRVIARLSTTAFRNRQATPGEMGTWLDAAFVLRGSYATVGKRLLITAELVDTRCDEVVWADRISGDMMDLMHAQSELINRLASTCTYALLNTEVQRSQVLPLPQLDSSTLMLGGIALMQRATPRDLQRSHQLLEAVAERHKRVATPWAWLAKWHMIQVVQGLSADPAKELRHAISIANRALDLEPTSTLAMAIKGHALCHLGSDVDEARRLLREATQSNPTDPVAWLYAGFCSAMWGKPNDELLASERAMHLSPLDPQFFYFQMLNANSFLAAHRHDQAIEMCRSSQRSNRYHLPTLGAMLVAQFESGKLEDARQTFAELRTHQPLLTVASYLKYGQDSDLRQRAVKAFQALGLASS